MYRSSERSQVSSKWDVMGNTQFEVRYVRKLMLWLHEGLAEFLSLVSQQLLVVNAVNHVVSYSTS